jgi:hypothetical protein
MEINTNEKWQRDYSTKLSIQCGNGDIVKSRRKGKQMAPMKQIGKPGLNKKHKFGISLYNVSDIGL